MGRHGLEVSFRSWHDSGPANGERRTANGLGAAVDRRSHAGPRRGCCGYRRCGQGTWRCPRSLLPTISQAEALFRRVIQRWPLAAASRVTDCLGDRVDPLP